MTNSNRSNGNTPSQEATQTDTDSSRRRFLSGVSAAAAGVVAGGALGLPAMLGLSEAQAGTHDVSGDGHSPQEAQSRRTRAYQLRVDAARYQYNQPLPAHPNNGDETRYANKIGNYSKALPHNALGEVDMAAYAALTRAIASGLPADYEAIPLGGIAKLANPQACEAFELEGADSHALGMPAAPALASEETAGEMVEDYWRALTRDVPFSHFGYEPLSIAAVADLAKFTKYSGISAGSLFRGNTPADLAGPFLSQFLWQDVPYGATTVPQRNRTTVPGNDHMTSFADWLNIQNGGAPTGAHTLDSTQRYIRNGRDLGEWVHHDFPQMGFMNAALILLGYGAGALDAGNPYRSYTKQGGFCTFGAADILDRVTRVANEALKAAWYQKWEVHRRLRPEAYGGLVHNHMTGAASYPVHAKVLNSQAVQYVHSKFGTYLLPMAYPEGSPTHTAFPAGHATIAGACATVLKAFFNEAFEIPAPVMASDDGLSLLPYSGSLTVGGELNKLAANISLGRDTAGVHWRSDGIQGMRLGEALAISILRDRKATYNEPSNGFSLTKFDGTTIVI